MLKKNKKKSNDLKIELKKVNLNGHFTQKRTQISSQKNPQQSKIILKSPQTRKYTQKSI